MKIALILPKACLEYSGGVPVQGRMWKEGLEQNGDEVDLISAWGYYEWNSYDYIIFMGIGPLLKDYVNVLSQYTKPRLVIAPIIDFQRSVMEYKLRVFVLNRIKFTINKWLQDFSHCRDFFDFYLARSEHEKNFIVEGLGIDSSKVEIVPLSVRFKEDIFIKSTDIVVKENFCLHVSRLADKGKNVERLVAAAKKYKFDLCLAGSLYGKGEQEWFNNLIQGIPNVKYLGYLSEIELKKMYKRAKVFALPSLVEGVGFVALEAAVYGAEIVLTKLGAPKEYYDGRAFLVSPFDIDEIGIAICSALKTGKSQPELSQFILDNYSFDVLSKMLHDKLLKRLN